MRKSPWLWRLLLTVFLFSSCTSGTGAYLSWRIFPEYPQSQGVRILEAGHNAQVQVDSWGVGHINAKTEGELFFALGYMEGRDRRFQMEILSRLGSGRLRELIGDRLNLETVMRLEVLSRGVGLEKDTQAFLEAASPQDLLILEAFAQGVNYATAQEPIPLEYRLLGVTPQTWRPLDSALIISLISFGLTKNWEFEVQRMELMAYGLSQGKENAIDRVLSIWPPARDWGGHVWPEGIQNNPEQNPLTPGWKPKSIPGIALDPELKAWLESQWAPSHRALTPNLGPTPVASGSFPENFLIPDFLGRGFASNNWAISAERNAGRGALLASDPHLAHMLPSIGYLVDLTLEGDGGYQITGATFIGVPGVVFGTNGSVAWGVTANWADVSDVVVEKDEGSLTEGEMEFKIRDEDGTFRKEFRPLRTGKTGVVLNDLLPRLGKSVPILCLQRQRDPGPGLTVFRQLYHSKNVMQARESFAQMRVFVGHWVLADTSGSIAYLGSAALPLRKGAPQDILGTVPRPSGSSRGNWEGSLYTNNLPWIENPQEGIIVTANQQAVDPQSFPGTINFEGDVPLRWGRIREVLNQNFPKNSPSPEDSLDKFATLQVDSQDNLWPLMKEEVIKTWTPSRDETFKLTPEHLLAKKILENWHGEQDRPGAILFTSLVARSARITLSDECSPETLRAILVHFNNQPLVVGILTDPLNPAWDDLSTPVTETRQEVLRKELQETMKALQNKYGESPSDWSQNKVFGSQLKHSFSSTLGSYVDRSINSQGSINSVNKHQFSLFDPLYFEVKDGPVLRFSVDLGTPMRVRAILPGGQSGHPGSPHYDDQLPRYNQGSLIDILRNPENILKDCVLTLRFTGKT